MQYITHLKAKDSHKNIKKGFVWDNIPQFAVIIGENGSGKSSLLQGIRNNKFVINNHQRSQGYIELYDEFKLQGNYNSNFIAELNNQEERLINQYLTETDFNNPANTFMRAKNTISQWGGNYPQEIKELTFQQFIIRDFSTYSESVKTTLNQIRDDLRLPIYSQHFKLNGMSEEKFYLSTYEEIKQWFSQLQDRNFESRQTIFNESVLNAIFGDYLIRRINIRDDFDNLDENLSNKEIKQRIEQEIGKNPLDEINRLLKQVYSKYTLVSELKKDNCQPQIVCKTQEGIAVPLKELSTGEQIIISLYMWRYDKNPLHSMILLFDEPDAHLNPKMAKMLIDVLKNVIVKEFGCQVIMTTHTLSTVAYCEDDDLFYMEDGKIWDSSRDEAIENLAQGIVTESFWENIDILLNSSKILFVEGKTDKKHLERFFSITSPASFKIIDCKSADKMSFYARMIQILGNDIANKCLFLLDDDDKGREKQKEIDAMELKTMLVSQGQNKEGENFTIENCYDSLLTEAHNKKHPSCWDNNQKRRFSQKKFKIEEMQGIKKLVEEIKKELKISK